MARKIAVVGNRSNWYKEEIFDALDTLHIAADDEIISGGAEGVDTFAQHYAKLHGCKCTIFYPNPKIPSPERYFRRNRQIVHACDIVVAFDRKPGRSGTKNTISYAESEGKEVVLMVPTPRLKGPWLGGWMQKLPPDTKE